MKPQYEHDEASHKAPQCTHLQHVSKAIVFSHAARKLLQIPPSENSLIHKTLGKHIQRTKTAGHDTTIRSHSSTSFYLGRRVTVCMICAVGIYMICGYSYNEQFEREAGTKNGTEYGDCIRPLRRGRYRSYNAESGYT
jgi:hypothetical protein